MYDVIVYSGTVLPALGPFKKISLSGYSTTLLCFEVKKSDDEGLMEVVDVVEVFHVPEVFQPYVWSI